jgi:predicted O-methyltransferase YrrM
MYPIQEEKILRVLHRLEEEDAEDRRTLSRPREERMFTLHPDTARLIHIMIQSTGCKRLVEIGAAYGYSAIWLAHAARITGGKVTSLEINPKLIEIGQRNLAESGLADMVEYVPGDARETLDTLETPFDFVLLDCWEWLYVEILDILAPKLRPGGILVADNVNPGHSDSDNYIQALYEYPLMETVSVPIGREIEVSMRRLET